MSDITIYHNGGCSKSRGALEILMEEQIPHNVRWYLTEPLNKKELRALLKKLGLKPSEIVRRSEPLYKDNYAGKEISEKDWLTILKANPELIERPIVENDTKAVIARPPERVHEITGKQ